jgi:hypothetical protein
MRLLIVVVIIVGVFSGYRYVTSFRSIQITYKNVSAVTVYDISGVGDDGGDKKVVGKITESGKKIRLKKGRSFSAAYTGIDGYDSSEIRFGSSQVDKTIAIDPYYSDSSLNQLLEQQYPVLQSILRAKYPNISLYTIQKGKLYHWGDWYGTTLTYVGSDYLNRDTLRVILKKENGQWVIKTDPPSIVFSKFNYPDIPVDILSAVNNTL